MHSRGTYAGWEVFVSPLELSTELSAEESKMYKYDDIRGKQSAKKEGWYFGWVENTEVPMALSGIKKMKLAFSPGGMRWGMAPD